MVSSTLFLLSLGQAKCYCHFHSAVNTVIFIRLSQDRALSLTHRRKPPRLGLTEREF
jgi:hypothetical protein